MQANIMKKYTTLILLLFMTSIYSSDTFLDRNTIEFMLLPNSLLPTYITRETKKGISEETVINNIIQAIQDNFTENEIRHTLSWNKDTEIVLKKALNPKDNLSNTVNCNPDNHLLRPDYIKPLKKDFL